jgi:hypothetical protein
VQLPRVLRVDVSPSAAVCAPGAGEEDVAGRRWAILLHAFAEPEWVQMQTLTVADAGHALDALACFHARWWDAVPAHLGSALFHAGAWWRRSLRRTVDHSAAPATLAKLRAVFPGLGGEDAERSLALMRTLADGMDRVAEQVEGRPVRTLVHGDAKPGNLFLHRDRDRDRDAGGHAGARVGLIDFQWTGGAANGGADVAYVLLAGTGEVGPDVEGRLLGRYHASLTARLASGGKAAYPWDEFLADYEWEVVSYFATALVQLCGDLTPAVLASNVGRHGWLTHEYDEAALRWLVHRGLLAVERTLLGRPAAGA